MSPYKSERQRKWMHANEPELAAKWDAEYGGKPRRERTQSKRSKRRKNKRPKAKEKE